MCVGENVDTFSHHLYFIQNSKSFAGMPYLFIIFHLIIFNVQLHFGLVYQRYCK